MLTEEIKSKIIEHANTSNNEVCGLVVHSESGLGIQKTENLINSATEFMMNFDNQSNVAAYYHSTGITMRCLQQAKRIFLYL